MSGNRGPAAAVSPKMGAHPAIPYVLLVDDEDDDYFLIAHLLTQAGVTDQLIRFSSGTAALRFLAWKCRDGALPALILLDVKMPGIGGFDLLAWIRSQRELAGVMVFMLSGGDTGRDREQARELGADYYLTKFPSAILLRKLLAEMLPWSKNFRDLDHRRGSCPSVSRASVMVQQQFFLTADYAPSRLRARRCIRKVRTRRQPVSAGLWSPIRAIRGQIPIGSRCAMIG